MCLAAAAAPAHIVLGPRTLGQLTGEADLVLRARIAESGERVGLSTEAGALSRPTVAAEVLEVLAGSYEAPHIRFAQHGHGVAPFSPDEEVLLFLHRSDRSRELRALTEAGLIDWVSLQEHDEEHVLTPRTREPLLAAVRYYLAARTTSDAEARTRALRAATLSLLTSGDDGLAASAIQELVLAPDTPLVAGDQLPRLEPLLVDSQLSMGVRAALLAELERRGLLTGRPFWLRWLAADTPVADRVTALRASGATRDPQVADRVVALSGDADAEVAAAAAAALAGSGADQAVSALARALDRPEQKVRYAAIRALGALGGTGRAAARAALAGAAASHPDPATQRRARAELAKRDAGDARGR